VSFDLFVGCFRNGQKATFPRATVEQHFGPYVTRREPTCLTLTFANDGQSYLHMEDSASIEGFNINRPVASTKLYDALLLLLRAENLVLYMPGNCPPLVANMAAAKDLPADMIDSLGAPVILSSSNEIATRIHEA